MSENTEILQRITALETTMTNRWESHDRVSLERNTDIRAQLSYMNLNILSMKENCIKRPPLCMENIEKKIAGKTRMYVMIALGVPGLLLTLISLWNITK